MEVEGPEALEDGGGASEAGMGLSVVVLRFGVVFLVREGRGEGNGADHDVEEDEEDGGGEPAVHGSPDRRNGRYGVFKHGGVLERERGKRLKMGR